MSQNVVITGANRGIGLALCKRYKELNCSVYAVCRNSTDELDKIAINVIDGVDIACKEDCLNLAHQLSTIKIDLLINNAGVLMTETFGELNFVTIEKQFQVNAMGALRITEGLIDNFSKKAKIAIISSRMGSIADNERGGMYGYRMSKAAVNAAGKSLAIDLKTKNIAVGIFHPGLVATDMVGANADISPDQAALRLSGLIDNLDMSNSGTFWHSNGEILPW